MGREKFLGMGYGIVISIENNTQFRVEVTLDGIELESSILYKDMFYRNPENLQTFISNLQQLLAHIEFGYTTMGTMAHVSMAMIDLLSLHNRISKSANVSMAEFHTRAVAVLRGLSKFLTSGTAGGNRQIFARQGGRFARSIAPLLHFVRCVLKHALSNVASPGNYHSIVVNSLMAEHLPYSEQRRWGMPYQFIYTTLRELEETLPEGGSLEGCSANARTVLRAIAVMDVVRYMALQYDQQLSETDDGLVTSRLIRKRLKEEFNHYVSSTKMLLSEPEQEVSADNSAEDPAQRPCPPKDLILTTENE